MSTTARIAPASPPLPADAYQHLPTLPPVHSPQGAVTALVFEQLLRRGREHVDESTPS